MTPFNPNNKVNLTMGEVLDPAMNITDREDAQQYLQAYAAWIQRDRTLHPNRWRRTTDSSLKFAKANIGYYAGYFDNETRKRVESIFDCVHPYFGSIERNGPPDPKLAWAMGQRMSAHITNGGNAHDLTQNQPMSDFTNIRARRR